LELDKLELLFEKKHQDLSKNSKDSNEAWVDYCDKYKIVMMHSEWVREEFNNPRKNMVCIHNVELKSNEYVCDWLLVPKKFAEKCLILGGLP
jgi:hypothetical protein